MASNNNNNDDDDRKNAIGVTFSPCFRNRKRPGIFGEWKVCSYSFDMLSMYEKLKVETNYT